MNKLFLAPELLHKYMTYDFSADIWSLGCMIFNMVTGIPPFYDDDEEMLKMKIIKGQYLGEFPEFDRNASDDLRSLVESMLKPERYERIDSDALLQDKWVKSAHQQYRKLSRTIVSSAFQNMKSFMIGYQLQRAAIMHMIATGYIDKKEKNNLKMIFDALDDEKDGEIELKEFVI